MSQGQWEQHQPVKVIDLGTSPATGDGSRQVDVRVPGPAWPTSQFSTVKCGMSREVGRGSCVGFMSKGRAPTDRYETRFDSDYDAPRMRGIVFWNADWFRFRCFGAGAKD